MNVRAVVQLNHDTGEKNVAFTPDILSPVGDFLVNWPNSEVIEGRVHIISDNADLIRCLLDVEFRGVDNPKKNTLLTQLTDVPKTEEIERRVKEEVDA